MRIIYAGDANLQQGNAYNVINYHLLQALRQKVEVLHNVLNDEKGLGDVFFAHQWPLSAPPRWLSVPKICMGHWEAKGIEAYPALMRDIINTHYDAMIVATQWVREQLQPVLRVPVFVVPLATELTVPPPPPAFAPEKESINMIWFGGTQERHGVDVAVQALQYLPDNYRLFVKFGADYRHTTLDINFPSDPRLIVRQVDMERSKFLRFLGAFDLGLHTARGLGFSLPFLEMLAVGLHVVSSEFPSLHDFGMDDRVTYAKAGDWYLTQSLPPEWDVRAYFLQTDPQDFAKAILQLGRPPRYNTPHPRLSYYTWERVAEDVLAVLRQVAKMS